MAEVKGTANTFYSNLQQLAGFLTNIRPIYINIEFVDTESLIL